MTSTFRHLLLVLAATTVACAGTKDTGTETGPVDTDTKTDTSGLEWDVVTEHADGAFLSMSGPDTNDLWMVGSDTGSGPLMYNYDGSGWTKHDTGTSGDLWWVWNPGGDNIYTVGGGGRVVVHNRTAGTYEETVLNPDAILFGIWGSSESDIWTVGGETFSTAAQLWHYDGTSWTEWTTNLPAEFGDLFQAFKVWGTGANDVWVIGTGMYTMHWDGSAWTYHDTGIDSATAGLFTVTGDSAGNVYTVGGAGSGIILSWDGSAWVDESPEFSTQLTGVYSTPGGDVVTCGQQSHVYHRGADGVWTEDERGSASILDMHACWIDESGGVWAIGGYLTGSPMSDGFIAYGGDSPPSSL